MQITLDNYLKLLSESVLRITSGVIHDLANDLLCARRERRSVFLCGNGGSAANALHWANDLIYGASKGGHGGVRAHALPANPSVCTCLANDEGYEEVFAAQLRVLGSAGDLVIVFSGSGNSPNILKVLDNARGLGIKSWAIVGFDGGKALSLADRAIHFAVQDMQIAEDCQMVLGHAVTGILANGE
jgi:D-sedoheptulose 7-phosphate isomerase